MKKNNGSIYLRNVKRLMPIYRTPQKEYLHTLSDAVKDYCIIHPNPDYDELVEHFGSPQEIIGDYLRAQQNATLIQQVNRKIIFRKIFIVLLFCALICSCAYSFFCYRAYLHCIQSDPVYITTEVEVIE